MLVKFLMFIVFSADVVKKVIFIFFTAEMGQIFDFYIFSADVDIGIALPHVEHLAIEPLSLSTVPTLPLQNATLKRWKQLSPWVIFEIHHPRRPSTLATKQYLQNTKN